MLAKDYSSDRRRLRVTLEEELSWSKEETGRLVAEKQEQLEKSWARRPTVEELSRSREEVARLAAEKLELIGEFGLAEDGGARPEHLGRRPRGLAEGNAACVAAQ
uniref:Uncharacterized protein n=1 Tax=Arundo donax TaxID=35708 RepID=A0A0A9A6U6_ARUDO